MKKILLIMLFCLLSAQVYAQSVCSDPADDSPYVSCLLTNMDPCETSFTGCTRENYLASTSTLISRMINKCCIPGNTDAEWDACFENLISRTNRDRALPRNFRRYVVNTMRNYINDPELECTEH